MPVLNPFRGVFYNGPTSILFTPGEHKAPVIDPALLVRDQQPALFFYRQCFRFPGDRVDSCRDSIIGLLDRTRTVIYPHEEIFPEQASACRRSVEEKGLESSPLFLWCHGEYSTDTHQLRPLWSEESGANQLWRITDAGAITRVQQALAGKELFLADGHHRFAAGWQLAAIHCRQRDDIRALQTLPTPRVVIDQLTVDALENNARRSILLPPKSTDFFPKVAGGLVMHWRQKDSVKPPVAQMPGVRYASS